MSRYGTKCSWGKPPCTVEFRAPSLYLLHRKVLDHLQAEHADTPEEVAGFYVEWEDASGVWHRLPTESVGHELLVVGARAEQGEMENHG